MAEKSNCIEPYTLELCKKISGKNLIESYMQVIHERDWSISENKQNVLNELNSVNNTNYDVTVLNRWIAGTKPVPRYLESHIRAFIFAYLFGDDVAEHLKLIF